MMNTMIRNFPLPSIQCGAMLGNGWTGCFLWGSHNQLNLTLGCADLWDHRGGMEWSQMQNYIDIRKALECQNEDAIRNMFVPKNEGSVRRPSLIPVGRLVITLPEDAELLRFEQSLNCGKTSVFYRSGIIERELEFYADMSLTNAVACSGLEENTQISLIPSYELFQGVDRKKWHLCENNSLEERGFEPASRFKFNHGEAFIQTMPADPSFHVIYRRNGKELTLSFQRGINLKNELEEIELHSFIEIQNFSRQWWEDYWKNTPKITHDDLDIEELYWHGLYKYGIMTNPEGVTPGLQGPWIEDDRLPPWSGDYHFNINVQMCNTPGFNAGKFKNLRKFFDLVLSWKKQLRHNAKCFAGIENGYMLPHAVDDRCRCMGSFWTGTLDHACFAWVAMMMYDYCLYSGDTNFLRSEVYDFMEGGMRVFQVMIEEKPDGSLFLPISISPEYRDARMDAWGSNSSYHLAAVHRLADNLIKASAILGTVPDPFWLKIREKLPKVSVTDGKIGLWDGLLLKESHRHHSHLSGIYPFDIIDPEAFEWSETVKNALEMWVKYGMGEWTGWCLPWAAQIYTRTGNGDMTNLILKIWKTAFTNAGGGSLHDARFKGLTIYSDFRGEIMQMDGAMGAVTAIQEQYLHSQNEILRVFYGTPSNGRNLSFSKMCATGGFRVSGKKIFGKPITLKITATRDALLKIKTPETKIFQKHMQAGETLRLVQKENLLCLA